MAATCVEHNGNDSARNRESHRANAALPLITEVIVVVVVDDDDDDDDNADAVGE